MRNTAREKNMVLGFLYTATAPLSFAQVYNNFPQNQHSEEYIRSALDVLDHGRIDRQRR